jgi:histidyl-tRNA synthetase
MAPALDELQTVVEALTTIGHPVEISMALVRDFEYYTGPVFRYAGEDGIALGAGGRYDALVHHADGSAAPACGFALSMERIAARLPAPEPGRAQVVQVEPVAGQAGAIGLALSVAQELQSAGFCAELVGSRRGPECRWLLTVNQAAAGARYALVDLQTGDRLQAASMEQVITALGRGRC